MRAAIFAAIAFFAISGNAKAIRCHCPSDLAANGSKCGRRSAFCRPGGERPMCGAKSEAERAEKYGLECYRKASTGNTATKLPENSPSETPAL